MNKIQLTGGAVVAVAGVIAAVYLGKKLKDGLGQAVESAKTVVTEKLNPVSEQNYIYNGLGLAGNSTFQKNTDKFFASIDLLNPFNESDVYAKQVFNDEINFFTETINPASKNNLVNKTVGKVVGDERLSSSADRIFGALDLLNPFNESDAYARQVWGLE